MQNPRLRVTHAFHSSFHHSIHLFNYQKSFNIVNMKCVAGCLYVDNCQLTHHSGWHMKVAEGDCHFDINILVYAHRGSR